MGRGTAGIARLQGLRKGATSTGFRLSAVAFKELRKEVAAALTIFCGAL